MKNINTIPNYYAHTLKSYLKNKGVTFSIVSIRFIVIMISSYRGDKKEKLYSFMDYKKIATKMKDN